TDRFRYLPGDTVNLWGLVRDRDTGTIPDAIALRLFAEGGEDVAPAVATVTRHPSSSGVAHGSLPLANLPDGDYRVTMSIGSRVIRSLNIVVGPIAKPAYNLELPSGHGVYVAGDQVKITATATFFEGTPVAGVDLRFGGM